MVERDSAGRAGRSGDDGTRRGRSTGFPIVPLAEAVRIVREAARYSTDFSAAAFASYMGHTTTNSGRFKHRLASFRSWGLITTSGERIALSDLGKRVALPVDPAREQEALREAFAHCDVFARVYDASAKGRPLDLGAIANSAVLNLGVAAVSKEAFASSFLESIVAARLARPEGSGKVVLLANDENSPSSSPEPDAADGPATGAERRPGPSAAPTTLRQAWPVGGGELLFELRLDRPLPVQAFGRLQSIAEAMQTLADLLGPPAEGRDAGAEWSPARAAGPRGAESIDPRLRTY